MYYLPSLDVVDEMPWKGKMRQTQCHQENMSVQCIPIKPHFYIAKLGNAGVYVIVRVWRRGQYENYRPGT